MFSSFRNASIGVKVSLAPVFAIVCLAVVASIGWWANSTLNAKLRSVGEEGLSRIIAADQLVAELKDVQGMLMQSLAWEGAGFKEERIADLDKRIVARMDTLAATIKTQRTAQGEHAEAIKLMDDLAKSFDSYRAQVKEALDMKRGAIAMAATFLPLLESANASSQKALAAFVAAELAETKEAVVEGEAVATRNASMILAGFVIALALAIGLSVVCVRAITRPLTQASRIANDVAQGNLTHRGVDASTDATGQVLSALEHVSVNLSGIVGDIRRAAEEIDTSCRDIAAGNADLSTRTENTASALQQTAASTEQIAQTLRQSAENAQSANALAASATQVAREGGAVVSDAVTAMEAIETQAKRIREIIGTIDGIAFQTNILALNAAVEAARAGEQGRGFAVVAQEVRSLAGRSSAAAKEIRDLIGTSVEQVRHGADKVQLAGSTMTRIVDSIERLSTTVGEITRATAEQASGIAQVNLAVSEMDKATQQNAAMVEEASAATESLRTQAGKLVSAIGTFRTA